MENFLLNAGIVEKPKIEDMKRAKLIVKTANIVSKTYWIGMITGFASLFLLIINVIFQQEYISVNVITALVFISFFIGFGIGGFVQLLLWPRRAFLSLSTSPIGVIILLFIVMMIMGVAFALAILCPAVLVYILHVQMNVSLGRAERYMRKHPEEV